MAMVRTVRGHTLTKILKTNVRKILRKGGAVLTRRAIGYRLEDHFPECSLNIQR
jgi:hypothetical protein